MAWRASLHAAAGAPVGDAGVAAPFGASRRSLRDGSRHDPSAPAREALELMSCVYNFPSEWTSRAPVVFLALLVEAPPDPTLPWYKRPRVITPEHERHHMWRVAGVTEPLRVARDARSTRFSVPVHLDRLAGPLDKVHRDALAKRRVALALYRIPDHDDADDVYVAADENLPPERRPLPPTSRLDDFAYLGEAKIRLDQLLTRVRAGGGRSGERGSRHRYAIAPARARAETRPMHPEDAPAASNAAVEVLAAVPARWPRPDCRDGGRYVGDFLLHFSPPRIHLEPEGTPRAVHARLCRWAGDGFQPVYSTLVAASDVQTEIRPVARATAAAPARARASGVRRENPDDARPSRRASRRRRHRRGRRTERGCRFYGAFASRGRVVARRIRRANARREGRAARMARRDAEDARARGARRDARKSRGVSVRVRARHRRFRRRAVGPGGGGHAARRDARAVGASTGTTHRSSAVAGDESSRARSRSRASSRGGGGKRRDGEGRGKRRDGEGRGKRRDGEGRDEPPRRSTFEGGRRRGGDWRNVRRTRRRNVDGRRRVFRRVVRVRRRRHGDAEARGKDGEDAAVQDVEDAAVKMAKTPPSKTAKTPPSKTAKTPPSKTAKTPPSKMAKTPPSKTPPSKTPPSSTRKTSNPNPNPANSSRRRTRAEKLDPPRWNSSTRTGVARPNHARFRRGGVVSKTTEDSERDANSAPTAMTPAMTPTRALLERAFREKGMTTLDREDAPTTIRARGAVFPGETTAEDATGNVGGGGTDGKSSTDGRLASANAPRPPTPPCAAEVHFAPDPGLIAAADAAVREAVDERLRERSKPELVDAALRVRGTSHEIERRVAVPGTAREARGEDRRGEERRSEGGTSRRGRMIRVGEMDRGG